MPDTRETMQGKTGIVRETIGVRQSVCSRRCSGLLRKRFRRLLPIHLELVRYGFPACYAGLPGVRRSATSYGIVFSGRLDLEADKRRGTAPATTRIPDKRDRPARQTPMGRGVK